MDVGYDPSTWSSRLEVLVYDNHRQLSVVAGLNKRANHWGPSPTLRNFMPSKTSFVMYSRKLEKQLSSHKAGKGGKYHLLETTILT